MYTYIVLSRVPSTPACYRGTLGFKEKSECICCGHASGIYPVRYGSVGLQLTRLRALYQGTLTSGCVWKNLNTSYLYNAAILASFFLFACLKACFRLSLSTRNKKKRTITSKKHAYRPETSYVLYYSLKFVRYNYHKKPCSCPADHVSDWQPRILLSMVEAGSVNVKNTHTCNLINTYVSLIPPWEDQREWHRMTRMTRPDCAVMCNLINTHTHSQLPHTSHCSTGEHTSLHRRPGALHAAVFHSTCS